MLLVFDSSSFEIYLVGALLVILITHSPGVEFIEYKAARFVFLASLLAFAVKDHDHDVQSQLLK